MHSPAHRLAHAGVVHQVALSIHKAQLLHRVEDLLALPGGDDWRAVGEESGGQGSVLYLQGWMGLDGVGWVGVRSGGAALGLARPKHAIKRVCTAEPGPGWPAAGLTKRRYK